MEPVTLEDLKKIIVLHDLPDDHLKWILDRCEQHEYEDGQVMAKYGDPAENMWFILQGRFSFYMYVNGRQVHYYDFENNQQTGGAGGLLPYSRMKTSPGYSYAVGKVRNITLHKKYFKELEDLNPLLIQRLIGIMTERARVFATTQLQHEKVNALGQLAAGIAHELNNPAAAINRISEELTKRLDQNYALTEKLLNNKINGATAQYIQALVSSGRKVNKLTAMQRLEQEDLITDWLTDNGFSSKELVAESFVDAGLTPENLKSLKGQVSGTAFTHVLLWLENLLTSQRLTKDLEEASVRISNLVGAIKSHVHMDRTNELQRTDIHTDIENTVTLLGHKLREKNITLKKQFCNDMAEVPAYVGELNQVWTNIIDNAIYAVDKNGEIVIETNCDDKKINVKIMDNGQGISKENLSRIFDPFFTTKKVGEGTGIGLDVVNRIIKHHNGNIKVFSEPGRTEFTVCIPRNIKDIKEEQKV